MNKYKLICSFSFHLEFFSKNGITAKNIQANIWKSDFCVHNYPYEMQEKEIEVASGMTKIEAYIETVTEGAA